MEGKPYIYIGLVARRNNSRVHCARWGAELVAVKECFATNTPRPNPAAAAREFAALKLLGTSIEQSRGDPLAPLPLALCNEHATYAMSWVPGRPATEIILARSTTLDRAREVGQVAGDWLRRLHALRPLKVRRNDFETRIHVIEHIRAAADTRDQLVQNAAASLITHAAEAAALAMPASWIHGDMKSDNLLIDGRHVTSLEPNLVQENTVIYDLAPFINHLRLLHWTPRGIGQQQKLNAVEEAFLHAYSSDTGNWKFALNWLRCYLLIQAVSAPGEVGRLRALWNRWPARRELAYAIDDLESC